MSRARDLRECGMEPPQAYFKTMETTWRGLSGALVPDLIGTLRKWRSTGSGQLHLGTDSKNRGTRTHFVTALAVLSQGRGGQVIYRSVVTPRMHSLAQRLIHEATLSVEVATELQQALDLDIVIHIDANEDLRHPSAKYARSLAGMGLGSGFEVRLKPDAWCASHVADHVVKEKHVRAA